MFHPSFAQKLNVLALDLRPYHIGPVYRRKGQEHKNTNEGLGSRVGGTLSGSNQFLLSDGPWALPTAKLPAPFQVACPFGAAKCPNSRGGAFSLALPPPW
jgi:hypothetical protein